MTSLSYLDLESGQEGMIEEAGGIIRRFIQPVPDGELHATYCSNLFFLSSQASQIGDLLMAITNAENDAPVSPDMSEPVESESTDTGEASPVYSSPPVPSKSETPDDAFEDEDSSTAHASGGGSVVEVEEYPTMDIPVINPANPPFDLNTRASVGVSPLRPYLDEATEKPKDTHPASPQDILPWIFNRVKGSHGQR